MKFGPLPVRAAAGTILAHSVRAGGRTFRKGHVVAEADLPVFAQAGLESVIAVCLEPGDVDENEAACRVAGLLAANGLDAGPPYKGRVNLFARAPGVLDVDSGTVQALNRVCEAVTVATAEPGAPARAGQLVATVKIITFAVAGADLDRLERTATGLAPALMVAPYVPWEGVLLQTTLPGIRTELIGKTARVTAARMEALGGHLADARVCEHLPDAVTAELTGLASGGRRMLLVVGASATADRRDVVPAAIEAAGGRVIHFGMPVDPGNLTVFGVIGGCPVLGLPGSARSPRRSGFDRLMERIAAGLPVTADDITAMGVGGLMKEIGERPQPRLARARRAPAPPRVGAVLLAAGQSRRMGALNKLLAPIGGRPMVAHAAEAIRAAGLAPVWVVTGHEAERIRAALAEYDVEFVHNPDFALGLSTSLARGLEAVDRDVDGLCVCLGDMPAVDAAVLRRLVDHFDPDAGRAICVPTHLGKRGNPVLWARRFFEPMAALEGDVGARHLIGEHADEVVEVPMEGAGILADVDSPEALARFAADPPGGGR